METASDLWAKFIDDSTKFSLTQPPYTLTASNCGTCKYWHLVDEDTLEVVAAYSPKEYEFMRRGMKEGHIKGYEENGQVVDTYPDHIFYGFCKRFPPTIAESHSKLSFPSLSLADIKRPDILSGYRFPFLPHKESCGEWKQGEWVARALSKTQSIDK